MATTILITGATGLIGFRTLTMALAAGHNVRFSARSESKAQRVLSNPSVQKLSPGGRLSSVIVPKSDVPGAWDAALKGITHVIHIGSPVPSVDIDPKTDIWLPTVNGINGLLTSALAAPSVKRIVITSSVIANFGMEPDANTTYTASSRIPVPPSEPESFANPFEAYVSAKAFALQAVDAFIEEHKPHYTVAQIYPGDVFGRHDLNLDADSMLSYNNSSGWLMMSITGHETPIALPGNCCHLDDAADVHLRVAFLEPTATTPTHFGCSVDNELGKAMEYVAKAYPKALEEGVLTKGNFLSFPVKYDSSETERVLGFKFRSYESAVQEVANQYLDFLGKEKA